MHAAATIQHPLDKARRDLTDAAEHLGRTYYGHDTEGELRLAIEATIRAIGSVAYSVERLAELVEG